MKTLLTAALLGTLALPAFAIEGTVRPIIDPMRDLQLRQLIPTCPPDVPVTVSNSRLVCGKKITSGGSNLYVLGEIAKAGQLSSSSYFNISYTTIDASTRKYIAKGLKPRTNPYAEYFVHIPSNRLCVPNPSTGSCSCPSGFTEKDFMTASGPEECYKTGPSGSNTNSDLVCSPKLISKLIACYPN